MIDFGPLLQCGWLGAVLAVIGALAYALIRRGSRITVQVPEAYEVV
jgi:hypothetical protein